MRNFFKGLSYNRDGFHFFSSHPKLWKYVLIPTVINFLALIILVTFYLHYFNDIFLLLAKPFGGLDVLNPQDFWGHFFDGTLWIARQIIKILVFLLSLVLIFIAVFIVSLVINAPFFEALSEKILVIKGVEEASTLKGFVSNFIYSLKIEIYKFFIFAGTILVLFLLSWIPIVGPVFSILMFLFVAWMFAFGLCTYPLVLQHRPFTEMLAWGLKNKGLLIGFGLPSLIPFVGFFIIFFQVAGGTLLYLDHGEKNTLSNTLTSNNDSH